jgi:flagellar hook protein FlgE
MGILGALFSGVSGLDVYAGAIEVVGNNIANANTAGFKASRSEFSNILAQSLTGASSGSQIGRGVQLSAVTTQFTQGSFETTSSGTDLAIDGSGFFMVKNNDGVFYTRAGQFTVNAQGLLVNSQGDRVQGVLLDTSGNPSGVVQDLNLTVTNSPPKVTSKVNFVANLDASAPSLGTSGTATSGVAVTDQFQFITGTNDVMEWNDSVANVSASLITDGGLVSGNQYTAAQVAAAIKTALEATNTGAAAGDTYAVAYSAATKKFTVTNDTGNNGAITLRHSVATSTASDDLGFSAAADDSIAVSALTSSDNQVQFNVVNGRNTFTVDVDGNYYATQKTATVAVGAYTADGLAQAIEAAINAADSIDTIDRLRSVRATFDSGTNTNKFQISSQTTGGAKTIDISSDSNALTIPASSIRVSEASLGVLGLIDMDAGNVVNSDGIGSFDVTDPSNLNSSNFSTSLTLFDSLGSPHSINIFFRKIGENIWEYNGVMQGNEIIGPTGDGSNEQVLYGRLWFNDSGALDVEDKFVGPTNPDGSVNAADANGFLFPKANRFNFEGGAKADQMVGFDFGSSITTDGSASGGLDGVTQFAGSSAIINQNQDGFTTGTLQSISVNPNGNITGQFTNGQTRNLARIMLANFNAPQGLSSQGSSLFAETQSSGQPILGQATTAGFGSVLSNSVELSNVDIAEEFVKLIQDQQAFQANARIISTTEDLLDEVVNLTR